LQFARKLGLREDELVHIRRGALLHDIGNIAVPDFILRKPGPLTPEEWEIVRQHPHYSQQMISPIAYLRPAIHIPYCHHEKWDGSGYPRELRGEQIPLAARLFAIVDVWDALVNNRPYRSAWTAEKARLFIAEQAGKHFDPKLVPIFLNSA
jgi:response regulator RpfG family c-di-GMP phosphodiesterase